jgi:hypothetical protein
MALRDWVSGEVATATVATVATKPTSKAPTVASVASVAVAEPRKSKGEPTGPRTTTVAGNDTPTGDRITDAAIYRGEPTPEAIDVADAILTHLADLGRPATEGEITEALGGDPLLSRNVLRRLAVEGVAEALPGGLYQIPPYPPRPADLPEGCPLLGGPVPAGCRFEAKLLRRMMAEGALPLPGGRCPLRQVCKAEAMATPERGEAWGRRLTPHRGVES